MKAVILAAGKGTRMKEITSTIPKPMVLINGKPLLEHIISYIKNAEILDIGIVIGYKKDILKDYFGNGSDYGISITYIEQKEQNGTGAALHLAKDFVGDNPLFFTFGDVLTLRENYCGMIEYYTTHGCHILLGLNKIEDPYRGAAVYMDEDNTIVRIIEKPPKGTSTTNLHNAGLMVLTPEIFDYTAKLRPSPRGEYELTDSFEMIRKDGKLIQGYILSGYWKDVGTPEDLIKANQIFS